MSARPTAFTSRRRRKDAQRLGTWNKRNAIRNRRVQAASTEGGTQMTSTYIAPADHDLFRASKAELVQIVANSRSTTRKAAASAELERRALNRAAKKAGGRS